MAEVAAGVMDSKAGTFIAVLLVVIGTFSFFDILWILLAVGSAYKLASGGYEE